MSTVFTARSGKIGWIYVYHNELPNPVSKRTLINLRKAFDKLSSYSDVIILTGSGKSFLSGANISDMLNFNYEAAWEFSYLNEELSDTIKRSSALTIAAINGFCFGGANDIALLCDLRVAKKSAVFSHSGAKIGILTGWGGTYLLQKATGRQKANELFITAKSLTANAALKLNLVNRVFDDYRFYQSVINFAKSCLSRAAFKQECKGKR